LLHLKVIWPGWLLTLRFSGMSFTGLLHPWSCKGHRLSLPSGLTEALFPQLEVRGTHLTKERGTHSTHSPSVPTEQKVLRECSPLGLLTLSPAPLGLDSPSPEQCHESQVQSRSPSGTVNKRPN
jgi:hypothetical protein